jgi:hypothetical protein
MMNSASGQVEAAAQSHFLESIFNGFDHLCEREDLINRRVFEKEHGVTEGRAATNGALLASRCRALVAGKLLSR